MSQENTNPDPKDRHVSDPLPNDCSDPVARNKEMADEDPRSQGNNRLTAGRGQKNPTDRGVDTAIDTQDDVDRDQNNHGDDDDPASDPFPVHERPFLFETTE